MRSPLLCVAFFALAALIGCSGSNANPYSRSAYPVSGRVLGPNGEPVRGGAEILLTPKAKEGGVFGKDGSAQLRPDGTFALKTADGAEGVPGGFYLVVVRPYGAQNSAEKQAASRLIPKNYWSEDTSEMTVEITEAKTGWDLKLAK